MDDFLSRILDGASPDEQEYIKAAEQKSENLIADGERKSRDRLKGPGPDNRDWIKQPIDQARADAACTVFEAYKELLWRRTDKLLPAAINEFAAQLQKVQEYVVQRYGWFESSDAATRTRSYYLKAAWAVHHEYLEAMKTAKKIPVDALNGIGRSLKPTEFWLGLRAEFDRIAASQTAILGDPDHELRLKGYCFYAKGSGDLRHCTSNAAIRGRITSDFEAAATRAAIGIGCPPGIEPVPFWIFSLAQDLTTSSKPENRREFQGDDTSGGIILDLLVSSAGYCSRLATKAELESIGARTVSPAEHARADLTDLTLIGESGVSEIPASMGVPAASPMGTRRRRRGPQADDEGHRRIAEILPDDWANDIPASLQRLDPPADGGPPIRPSSMWCKKYNITCYGEVGAAIPDKEIRQHLDRRRILGRTSLKSQKDSGQ